MDPLSAIQVPAVQPAPPGPAPAPPPAAPAAGTPQNGGQPLQLPHLESVVRELNKAIQMVSTSITFSIDGGTGKTVIKVTDASTGKLIRQIPPEETLRIAGHLNELMGILYDKTR